VKCLIEVYISFTSEFDRGHGPLSRKSLVNFGPLIAEISMWNHTHPNWLFRKTICRPLEGAMPRNFYMR